MGGGRLLEAANHTNPGHSEMNEHQTEAAAHHANHSAAPAHAAEHSHSEGSGHTGMSGTSMVGGNKQHAKLFQKMYEQHGTPAWATRLVLAILYVLFLFFVLYSYESQIHAYELAAADSGVFRKAQQIELGSFN